jgi:hypothetical protein
MYILRVVFIGTGSKDSSSGGRRGIVARCTMFEVLSGS